MHSFDMFSALTDPCFTIHCPQMPQCVLSLSDQLETVERVTDVVFYCPHDLPTLKDVQASVVLWVHMLVLSCCFWLELSLQAE